MIFLHSVALPQSSFAQMVLLVPSDLYFFFPGSFEISKMAASNQAFIWFKLVDSHGEAYRQTRADYVSMSPNSLVVQFRDRAHEKNSSILEGIVPSQLTIFQNNNALKANEAALEEDSLVDGLGRERKDPLMVLVPSLTSTLSPATAQMPGEQTFLVVISCQCRTTV